MKKNISINLFGTLYNIDEDAYNLLENYLQSMQRYFSRQKGGEEVADDIEHRVAELLWQRHEAGMTAVNIQTVKEIIDTIGNAEQIAGESGNDGKYARDEGQYARAEGPGENRFKEDLNHLADDVNRFARNAYDKSREHVKTHRFYRCANDKILGGVCSGIAKYFDAGEPLIWRLGAIALTLLGVGLPLPIIYIVMWLVTPAALTPEDRLRQQGKAITPENLTQQVMDDSEPIIVKNENKGCLKATLIIIGICAIIPFIFFFSIWCKLLFNLF